MVTRYRPDEGPLRFLDRKVEASLKPTVVQICPGSARRFLDRKVEASLKPEPPDGVDLAAERFLDRKVEASLKRP